MSKTKRAGRELTGKHVLFMILAFFGVIFAVNGYFLYSAVTSFSGEDVKGSYRQGLEYNQTIAARKAQTELGWNVSANTIEDTSGEGQIIVKFTDDMGRAIEGLRVDGALRHPTDLDADKPLTFKPHTAAGLYIASIGQDVRGQWQLRAAASRGDETFKFTHSIQRP